MKRIAVIDTRYDEISTIESLQKIYGNDVTIEHLLPIETRWEIARKEKLYQPFDIFVVSAKALLSNFTPEKLVTELGTKDAKIVAISYEEDYLNQLIKRVDFCYKRSDFEVESKIFSQIKEQMLALL